MPSHPMENDEKPTESNKGVTDDSDKEQEKTFVDDSLSTATTTEVPKRPGNVNGSVSSSSDQDSSRNTESSSSASSVLGASSVKLSDIVNDNLIAVRYGALATVGLLAAYGMAQTPLFFRFRTVADIPASYCAGRKCLSGRLVRTLPVTTKDVMAGTSTHDQPIVCQLRHLSPMERILPRSTFELVMKFHPSSTILGKRPDQSAQDLLQVEISGIRAPPFYRSTSAERPGEWLERLAEERTLVTCQLLARRLPNLEDTQSKRTMQSVLPELAMNDDEATVSSANQVAVCKLYYRPKVLQLFATDVGESMVRFGRASAAVDGLCAPNNQTRIMDTTTSVQDLQKDAAYVERLGKAEYQAAKGSYGMWADENVRKERSDVISEVNFQTQAKFYQKVWRWIRGG